MFLQSLTSKKSKLTGATKLEMEFTFVLYLHSAVEAEASR
jgi:hypothetical protein